VFFFESSLVVCMFLKRSPSIPTNSASVRSGLLWLRAISHKLFFALPGLSCRLLVLPPGAAGPARCPRFTPPRRRRCPPRDGAWPLLSPQNLANTERKPPPVGPRAHQTVGRTRGRRGRERWRRLRIAGQASVMPSLPPHPGGGAVGDQKRRLQHRRLPLLLRLRAAHRLPAAPTRTLRHIVQSSQAR